MSIDTRPLWALIADWLPIYEEVHGLNGLCDCVSELFAHGSISYRQMLALEFDIDQEMARRGMDYTFYLWPAGALKPRVKWCLKMARRSER